VNDSRIGWLAKRASNGGGECDGCSNVLFRQRRKIGEDCSCRRPFGEAREYRLQRDARAFQDRLAAHNLRISHDVVLVVHA
jgi:hypothetical protein